MSPYKPAHRIACAHCAGWSAGAECPGCRRPLCPRCAADPSGCARPRVRVLELPRGYRLRAASAASSAAAATDRRGRLRALDLESGAIAGALEMPRWRWVGEALLAGLDARGEPVGFDRRRRQVRFAALCGCGEHPVAIGYDERVWLEGAGLAALPRQSVEHVAYDCGLRLLAVARRRVTIYLVGGDRSVEALGSAPLDGERAAWLACAAGRVAVLSARAGSEPGRHRLQVFRSSEDTFHRLPFYHWRSGSPGELRFRPIGESSGAAEPIGESAVRDQRLQESPVRAALSPEGHHLAVAHVDARVGVHDLRRGQLEVFGDHRGPIGFVGFADRGRLLVSGDETGRVVIRERDGEGYARWL